MKGESTIINLFPFFLGLRLSKEVRIIGLRKFSCKRGEICANFQNIFVTKIIFVERVFVIIGFGRFNREKDKIYVRKDLKL